MAEHESSAPLLDDYDGIHDENDSRTLSRTTTTSSLTSFDRRNIFGNDAQDNTEHPAPPEVYNWRPWVLAISAAMGSAMFGYDTAFIGGLLTLPSFSSRFGLDQVSGNVLAGIEARIVSTFQLGCIFGSIFVYYLNEYHGRRKTLMQAGVLFDCGALFQLISAGRLRYMYFGRFLAGLAVGSSSLVVPLYISECSPPAIRGTLIGAFEIMLQSFLVVGFWVNFGVNEHISPDTDKQWHIPVSLQLIPGTLLVLAMAFQPESPRWLVHAGKISKAKQVLSYIRNLPIEHEYIIWETESIVEQIEHEAECGADASLIDKIKSSFQPGKFNRLLIGCTMMIIQNLGGVNALNYYSTNIFRAIGFTGVSVGLLATGVYGILKCLFTFVFTFVVIEKYGRRKSLIYGSIGTCLTMFYIGLYGKFSGSFDGNANRDIFAYLAVLAVYMFAIIFTLSWSGVPWIYAAEIYPATVRSVCVCATTCSQWVGQFVIVYSTPFMMEYIKWGTFIFFGLFTVFSGFYVYWWIPETKGLSIEDMDIMFECETTDGRRMRKEADLIIAQRRIELALSATLNSSSAGVKDIDRTPVATLEN
ncbi:MFS quinate transporter QutD [Lipomyces oligophaga]|uniref:MFS quinate transporter QutD n=1 Tax=Lipomyces oligophaga TaxID=45792 RepID=UPI0034CEA1A8